MGFLEGRERGVYREEDEIFEDGCSLKPHTWERSKGVWRLGGISCEPVCILDIRRAPGPADTCEAMPCP